MSIELDFEYLFDNPNDYDTLNAEIDNGSGRLALSPKLNQSFTNSYLNDDDLVYNSALAEVVGGQVQQKVVTSANIVSASFFTTKDLYIGGGVLTGTLVNGAVVANGLLDLKGGTAVKSVSWPGLGNFNQTTQGAIEFGFIPNYSGNPSTNQTIFSSAKGLLDNKNSMTILHTSGGDLTVSMDTNSGAPGMIANFGNFNPVAGTRYILQFNWNVSAGSSRMFVDGRLAL